MAYALDIQRRAAGRFSALLIVATGELGPESPSDDGTARGLDERIDPEADQGNQ